MTNKDFKILQNRLFSDDHIPVTIEGLDKVFCNDLGIINKSYFSMTIVERSSVVN